jgi:hypothetical protein
MTDGTRKRNPDPAKQQVRATLQPFMQRPTPGRRAALEVALDRYTTDWWGEEKPPVVAPPPVTGLPPDTDEVTLDEPARKRGG